MTTQIHVNRIEFNEQCTIDIGKMNYKSKILVGLQKEKIAIHFSSYWSFFFQFLWYIDFEVVKQYNLTNKSLEIKGLAAKTYSTHITQNVRGIESSFKRNLARCAKVMCCTHNPPHPLLDQAKNSNFKQAKKHHNGTSHRDTQVHIA